MIVDHAWGAGGARALAADCDVLVVVDVLSFSTCVSIATSRGAVVRPMDPTAHSMLEPGELLAGPREGPGPTLSPHSLLGLAAGQRLVLPSPNGSAITAAHAQRPCVTAAIRNASAVAAWLNGHDLRVGIVSAGEHESDGRWRPAYEDLVGAGAVISRLSARRTSTADAAAVAYEASADDLARRMAACRSGAELTDRGFGEDIVVAAELDADDVVPMLQDGVFAPLT